MQLCDAARLFVFSASSPFPTEKCPVIFGTNLCLLLDSVTCILCRRPGQVHFRKYQKKDVIIIKQTPSAKKPQGRGSMRERFHLQSTETLLQQELLSVSHQERWFFALFSPGQGPSAFLPRFQGILPAPI